MYFIMGVMLGLILAIIVCKVHFARVQKAISTIAKPDEVVQSYDATILVDSRGEISWADNDKTIKLARKLRRAK